MRGGLESWFRGRAEGFTTNLHAAPAWTRRGEGTPPKPPPPRPFFLPSEGGPIEPRLRRLVADRLGVSTEELRADVSLVDELAADSLDMLEIAIATEDEFRIVITERVLEVVRTYGDLVAEVWRLVSDQRENEMPLEVRVRVTPLAAGGSSLERTGPLTPYLAQTIAEDAAHAGRGARLELTVPAGTDMTALAAVQTAFAGLGARGVEVWVRRQGAPGSAWVAATPTAASANH